MEANFSDARLRLMAGRIVAQNRWPYMSGVLFALKPVEVTKEEVPTLAVDSGWRLYYCPEFVSDHPVEVLATAILHETLHCVLDHMGRYELVADSKESSAQAWNYCGDAHINKALDDQDMPWGEFEPVRFKQLEQYGVTPDDSTEAAHRKVLNHLKENQTQLDFDSDCGSVATGGKRAYEKPAGDASAPSIGGSEQESVKDVLAIEVNRRKGLGEEVGDTLVDWASGRLSPVVDWRKHLGVVMRSSFAVASGKKDYSFSKPSRKQDAMKAAGTEVILPALRNPSPPSIALLVDTSGSISRSELELFGSELFGILKSIGSNSQVEVVGCDTKATGPFRIKRATDIPELELLGGGGTDLRVGIDFILQNLRTEIVVIASDGETPWHDKNPNSSKTYLALITTESGIKKAPSWVRPIFVTKN